MKYGEHLKANIAVEYGPEPYLAYAQLDSIISQLSSTTKPSRADETSRVLSMTAPPRTNAHHGLDTSRHNADDITDEVFLKLLETEMVKVEKFTLEKVTELRDKLQQVESLLNKQRQQQQQQQQQQQPQQQQQQQQRPQSQQASSSSKKLSPPRVEKQHQEKEQPQQQQRRRRHESAAEGFASSSNASLSETSATMSSSSSSLAVEVEARADEIASDFLRLEKYVNINFMGFHKILKKHDKNMPDTPCKGFYVNRMHGQAWVRGDYSDIVVRLSMVYSTLRDDRVAKQTDQASQSFLRSTNKYWIKTEDVSRVKYSILRHLPVFLQKTSSGESDSQFTNSVYLDNDQLELYHGRLDKAPGAIALRLRWYGPGDPRTVFVERKTHKEKWSGGVSVKERFIIDESEVQQVLTNTYPIAQKKQAMLDSGKSKQEADEWETLVREITQVIMSKQLVPTMRTQCMRTAFQIPFDATVRISLDTNLCMISERGYDLRDMKQWHRDKSWVLNKNEIHRFPHAVLEIKLQIGCGCGSMEPPKWVTELQNSGMLYEVHKYSKYTHGCSVLLPDDAQAVPYWIDDISLRQSIIDSDGERVLADERVGVGPGANRVYPHLLPFGTTVHNRMEIAVGRTAVDRAAAAGKIGDLAPTLHRDSSSCNNKPPPPPPPLPQHLYATGQPPTTIVDSDLDELAALDEDNDDNGEGYNDDDHDDNDDCICGWPFPYCSRNNRVYEMTVAPTSVQKIEPKAFLANERTFLHWIHHGVVLSVIASGILAFASSEEQQRGEEDEESAQKNSRGSAFWGQVYALLLCPISMGFCVYATHVYLWRTDRIKTRIPGRWDDPVGPIILGSTVAAVLIVNFVFKLYIIVTYGAREQQRRLPAPLATTGGTA